MKISAKNMPVLIPNQDQTVLIEELFTRWFTRWPTTALDAYTARSNPQQTAFLRQHVKAVLGVQKFLPRISMREAFRYFRGFVQQHGKITVRVGDETRTCEVQAEFVTTWSPGRWTFVIDGVTPHATVRRRPRPTATPVATVDPMPTARVLTDAVLDRRLAPLLAQVAAVQHDLKKILTLFGE